MTEENHHTAVVGGDEHPLYTLPSGVVMPPPIDKGSAHAEHTSTLEKHEREHEQQQDEEQGDVVCIGEELLGGAAQQGGMEDVSMLPSASQARKGARGWGGGAIMNGCALLSRALTSERSVLSWRISLGMALSQGWMFLVPLIVQLPAYAQPFTAAPCLAPLMFVVVWCVAAKLSANTGAVMHTAVSCTVCTCLAIMLAVILVNICAAISAVCAWSTTEHWPLGSGALKSALSFAHAWGFARILACFLLITCASVMCTLRQHPVLGSGAVMGLIVLGEMSLRPWTAPDSALARLYDGPDGALALLNEELGGGYAEVSWWTAIALWSATMMGLLLSSVAYTLVGVLSAVVVALWVLPSHGATAASRLLAMDMEECGHLWSAFSSNILQVEGEQPEEDGAVSMDACDTSEAKSDASIAAGRSHEHSTVRPNMTLQRALSLHDVATPSQLERSEEQVHTRAAAVKTFLVQARFEDLVVPARWGEDSRALETVARNVDTLWRRLSRLVSTLAKTRRRHGQQTLMKWWGSTLHDWTEVHGRCAAAANVLARVLKEGKGRRDAGRAMMSVSQELLEVEHLYSRLRLGILERYRANWRITRADELTPVGELSSMMFVSTYTKRVVAALRSVHDSVQALQESRQRLGSLGVCDELRHKAILWKERLVFDCIVGLLHHFSEQAMGAYDALKAGSVTAIVSLPSFRFNAKHTMAVLLSLLPVIVLAPLSNVSGGFGELTSEWQLFWLYVTVVIVFNRTLDATIFKVVLRILSTFLSVAIGAAIMWSCVMAKASVLLFCWILVVTFVCVYYGRGPYLYAYVLFLITQIIMIGCQFVPGVCASSWQYAVARCLSVGVGGFIAAAVSAFVFPSWAFDEVQDCFANMMDDVGRCTEELVQLYIGVEKSSSSSTAPEFSQSDLDAFHFLTSERVGLLQAAEESEAVQLELQRLQGWVDRAEKVLVTETVGWTRGPLHIPRWCAPFLFHARELASNLRLTLRMINRDPVVIGEYAGTVGTSILDRGGSEHLGTTCAALINVCSAVRLHFTQGWRVEGRTQRRKSLREALSRFRESRLATRENLLETRRRIGEMWAELERQSNRNLLALNGGAGTDSDVPNSEDPPGLQADDSFRYHSFMYSLSLVLDSVDAMVSVVLDSI